MSTQCSDRIKRTHWEDAPIPKGIGFIAAKFLGDSGIEEIPFDLGAEGFESATIDVLDQNRGNAYIDSVPRRGQSGGVIVKVHWSCDGLTGYNGLQWPSNSYVHYKVCVTSALGPPRRDRAVIVAIENAGVPVVVPTLADAQLFLQALLPQGELFHLQSQVFNDHDEFLMNYSQRLFLEGASCTALNLRQNLAAFTRDGYVVDLVLACRGDQQSSGETVIFMSPTHSGKGRLQENPLTATSIRDFSNEAGFNAQNLGVVYQMNGLGSRLNQTWVDLGFKASVGCRGRDFMPEFMLSNFWLAFLQGSSVSEAADTAWNRAKSDWQHVPTYEQTVTWVVVQRGLFFTVDRRLSDSEKVAQSRLLVAGDGNRTVLSD